MTVVPASSHAARIVLADAATTVALPVSDGITGTMTFPAVSTAATLRLWASTSAPAGVSLVQGRRSAQNVGTLAIYDYITMVPDTTVTLPSLPAFTLTLPPSIPTTSKSFFYAISAPHAAGMPSHFDANGPATLNGQAITFAAANDSLTLVAGQAYTFMAYATYAAPAGPTSPRIFVVDSSPPAVDIFNPDGSPATPAQIVTPTEIAGIAVDAAGKIYLTRHDFSSSQTDTLTTYNSDGSPASPTIRGLRGPGAVAVDAAGKIYVVTHCCGGNNPTYSVQTFDRNGAPTTPTITDGLNSANGVAVDRNGKIYVLNECCEFGDPTPIRITTYAPDGTRTTPTIILPQSLNFPQGIAVDAAGKIYVANDSNGLLGTALATFTAQGSPTTPTIRGAYTVTGVAVDSAGKIYLSTLGRPSFVRTFLPDGTATVPVIGFGRLQPIAIAVH